MSTLRVNTIDNLSGAGLANQIFYRDSNNVVSGSNNLTFDGTNLYIRGNIVGSSPNIIINGAMEVDQHNAYQPVSLNNSSARVCDRWTASAAGGLNTGTATAQSIGDAPPGFVTSLKYTVVNAKIPTTDNSFIIYQFLEGITLVDFAFGTPSAQPISLSFWVKSSLTGNFSGHVRTNITLFSPGFPPEGWRTYIFTYTIDAPNTWEYKTITIPGDTSLVPSYSNGIGMTVLFDLGSGPTWIAPANNTWLPNNYLRSANSINLISTPGATFQVTGVQLEKASVATPFKRRLWMEELDLCQRYYVKTGGSTVVFNGNLYTSVQFPRTMRATPDLTLSAAGIYGLSVDANGFHAITSITTGSSYIANADI
jgi:hypothetical protein